MSKRIVLVLAAFPQLSETFIVNKFVGLLLNGWDIHIVCSKHLKQNARVLLQLTHHSVQDRIHQKWSARTKWVAALLFPVALFNCLVRNFSGCLRYLSNGYRKHGLDIIKRFYSESEIVALRPDLIHFEFGATAIGRTDIGHLMGCKTIVSFRGYDLNYSGLDQPEYYADVWKYADGYHFLGNDLRKRGLNRGCPPEKPFALIPPAIDCDFFKPDKPKTPANISSSRPLRILSVGRLEWIKGYEYAFQAIRLLLDKGVPCEYHIIGDGSYLEPLAFTRHQLKLEKTVKFLGAKSRNEIKNELEWADVFLHAAVSEGFCNAVLEAQSMRIPVICSDAGGLSENVDNNITGFVAKRRDAVSLAEKMAQLAASPALRAQFGQAGRESIIRNFQLSDQIKKFGEFYLQILGSSEN